MFLNVLVTNFNKFIFRHTHLQMVALTSQVSETEKHTEPGEDSGDTVMCGIQPLFRFLATSFSIHCES